MYCQSTTISPRNSAAKIALVNVLLERSPSDLKLGYFTVLTIIAERKISTVARRNPHHLPRVFSFSLSWMISSVRDETSPAADGMGNPRNSFACVESGIAARQ